MPKGHKLSIDWPYCLHIAIFLVLLFGISHMEAQAPLTAQGMKVLGIFLAVLYAWTFIGIIWPSLAGLVALMVMKVVPPTLLMGKSFGDPIVIMMLFIFIFCATITHYGLSRFISLWFISRKLVRGRPWLFTFTFLGTVMLLGALTSGTPAVLLGWSLFYGVCELTGYKKGDSYTNMMLFGIVFTAQFGMAVIPFKAAPLAIIGTFEKISQTPISYAAYLTLSIASAFLLLLLYLLVAKFLFKPDMSKLANMDVGKLDTDGSLNLSLQQKLVLFFFFALLFCMLAPSVLPASFFLTRFINSIGYTGVCILIVMLMCCIRIKGEALLPLAKMIEKGVAWDILFLLALVSALSGPMSSPESGITQYFMLALKPIFGQNSQIFFALCLGLSAVLLTQVCNNVALGAALMPIIHTYCAANHYAPEASVILVVLAVHLAFLTPAASSPAALLHGNHMCSRSVIWKAAPLMVALSYAVIALLSLSLGRLVF